MKIEYAFVTAAVVLAAAGVYFYWSGNTDGAFVAFVLACAAFFLNMRFRMSGRNKARESESLAADDPDTQH
jgi:hypothetical protein